MRHGIAFGIGGEVIKYAPKKCSQCEHGPDVMTIEESQRAYCPTVKKYLTPTSPTLCFEALYDEIEALCAEQNEMLKMLTPLNNGICPWYGERTCLKDCKLTALLAKYDELIGD